MTVKELLGHKDITMTMRHTHLSPDHKRLAVQKLESAYKAEKKIIELPVAEKQLSGKLLYTYVYTKDKKGLTITG